MGYALYWEALGRVRDPPPSARPEGGPSVISEQVRPESVEDYRHAYLEACRILNDDAKSTSMKAEAMPDFHAGRRARRAARCGAAEKDPTKSVALYDGYIAKFDDNVS